MDIEKYKKEFSYDIERAQKNKNIKMFFDMFDSTLPEISKDILKISMWLAYTEWLQDWYDPKQGSIRI